MLKNKLSCLKKIKQSSITPIVGEGIMTIEELRKSLIEVTKNLENYTDRELVEIQAVGDKLKEMAMYETFLREERKIDDE